MFFVILSIVVLLFFSGRIYGFVILLIFLILKFFVLICWLSGRFFIFLFLGMLIIYCNFNFGFLIFFISFKIVLLFLIYFKLLLMLYFFFVNLFCYFRRYCCECGGFILSFFSCLEFKLKSEFYEGNLEVCDLRLWLIRVRKVWILGMNGVGFGIYVLGFGIGDGVVLVDCEDVVVEKVLSLWIVVEILIGVVVVG